MGYRIKLWGVASNGPKEITAMFLLLGPWNGFLQFIHGLLLSWTQSNSNLHPITDVKWQKCALLDKNVYGI